MSFINTKLFFVFNEYKFKLLTKIYFSRSFYVGPGPFYRLEFDGFTGTAGKNVSI